MTNSQWVFTIEDTELQEDNVTLVFPRGLSILLIKKGRDVYAISNKCAHMGCPLASGSLDGYLITCPCHDWQFDIRTGEFVDVREIKIPTYQWKVLDGKLFVNIEE